MFCDCHGTLKKVCCRDDSVLWSLAGQNILSAAHVTVCAKLNFLDSKRNTGPHREQKNMCKHRIVERGHVVFT